MEDKYFLEHKLKTAVDFEAAGKYLHSMQIYNLLIERFPEELDPYFNLVNLYEKLDNVNAAGNLLKGLLEGHPDSLEIRLFTGQFFLRSQRWNDAIDILSIISPQEEPIVSFFLGYSHFMLNEFELAKVNFVNFITVETKSELYHEALVYLAKIEIELKNFEKALDYTSKALAIYSNNWELYLVTAIAFYYLGMFAHAVSTIFKALKLNEKDLSVNEWAGKIYLKSGDYLKAEKFFLYVIEHQAETSPEIYTFLGEACLHSKKPVDAIKYFELALKLDPNNKKANEGKNYASSLQNKN
jgi:Flp pilus assembly protein TadD, contains TPR repeats